MITGDTHFTGNMIDSVMLISYALISMIEFETTIRIIGGVLVLVVAGVRLYRLLFRKKDE